MTDTNIPRLSLQIQLSATAVASSFVLLFVPNVETISLTAFLLGFLFPVSFAIPTILIMSVTWEILVSMVFAFSGFTFPFKIISWILIGFIGTFARKMSAKYFYEFLIFGGISAVVFDFIVTISTSFIFLGNQGSFLTVFYTTLIFGIPFTVSHTISNALLFSFIPVMMRTIIPLLTDYDGELLQVSPDHFDYLNAEEVRNSRSKILQLDKRRLITYSLGFILILSILGMGIYQAYFAPSDVPDFEEEYDIVMEIDYEGVLPPESHQITMNETLTGFQILLLIASVEYITQLINGEERPFIQAINGVWENQNITGNYWIIYINNQPISVDANSTYPVAGDIMSWRYQ